DLAAAVAAGQVEPVMVGGMDVGRSHNLTEIIVLGVTNTNQLPYRLGISLDRVEFDDQKAVVTKIMEKLPVLRFFIDRNGLGMQMAEDMEKLYPIKVEGMTFTQPSKELWSVELKLRLQRKQLPLPVDKDLSYQIHSIRKKITGSKKATFDTQANERHHADKYWALALAAWTVAAPPPDQEEIEVYDEPVDISPL
ncbi:MAG: hypothetical protein HND51_21340, partial [Chloroflexi bacterium]|nr:hypothetical protein [Chloroflexota bacterium]NOH14195.1 hypothetical protein [Chloroflexota bacterium]